MDVTYLGHSCFKLKGKDSTVLMDPYAKQVGFTLAAQSADIVTISHDHPDHNFSDAVKGTTRRAEPFVITAPGEYEIAGTSVFGVPAYHDDVSGQSRGKNTMYVVHLDGVSVAHLGDLGHILTDRQLEDLDGVDVLLCPVGGHYTIDAKKAAEVIAQIQPSIVVPMHFRTDTHSPEYAQLAKLDDFLTVMGVSQPRVLDKLSVSALSLSEETEVVILQ